ncbi:bifunctional (p)ppGpp synthetase/guanosine-3',5'-bis(diphosphate) 3'-pyrophosphohydrolase [Rouxiella silvae]|uniref:Bifunctional (P)ppGpp synthetase/guanosine-3',5'-bis(Diphosphate) 3'-pyrophosphohydrolase n=1 Tax=Rouxiella silvae TaxID=1646373 RepID=A0AA40X5A0_9GAMM|nr:HD domain-containing protein [Rouxiella silvae]MBF6638492.1 bifunctional (p)ppGpp synthetase/guanosine-3',5'-bis(diphosphate) 3'-pyrophosphohydrolase [Rouxiella silvae]
MTSLVDKARRYASKAHASINQRRKYTNDPYIVHPEAVANIVASVPHTQVMLAAAWLHDTVEDTQSTLDDITRHFGNEVAELVAMLTNVSGNVQGNRIQRKNLDRQHTAKACASAKTIKLADLIDNLRSLVTHDPDFAKTYLVEKRLLLAVLKEGDATLWQQAEYIINDSLQRLHQPPYNVPGSWFHGTEQMYLAGD